MLKVKLTNSQASLGMLEAEKAVSKLLVSFKTSMKVLIWVVSASHCCMASRYNSKWLFLLPKLSTSDSSPTTISLIRYLVSAEPVGNQGTEVQVRLFCRVLSKDIKSQTATT